MSPANPACAPWCMSGELRCEGTECYYHPDSLDLPAAFETARASAYGKAGAYIGLSLGRALSPEFRHGAVPDMDSCLVAIGVGKHGGEADWIELTVAEARELAHRLTKLCDLAGADARALGDMTPDRPATGRFTGGAP